MDFRPTIYLSPIFMHELVHAFIQYVLNIHTVRAKYSKGLEMFIIVYDVSAPSVRF